MWNKAQWVEPKHNLANKVMHRDVVERMRSEQTDEKQPLQRLLWFIYIRWAPEFMKMRTGCCWGTDRLNIADPDKLGKTNDKFINQHFCWQLGSSKLKLCVKLNKSQHIFVTHFSCPSDCFPATESPAGSCFPLLFNMAFQIESLMPWCHVWLLL